jgi:hypothetical protein
MRAREEEGEPARKRDLEAEEAEPESSVRERNRQPLGDHLDRREHCQGQERGCTDYKKRQPPDERHRRPIGSCDGRSVDAEPRHSSDRRGRDRASAGGVERPSAACLLPYWVRRPPRHV